MDNHLSKAQSFYTVLQWLPTAHRKQCLVCNFKPFWPSSRPVLILIRAHIPISSPCFFFLPRERQAPAQQLQAVSWTWPTPLMHCCRPDHIFISLQLSHLDLPHPHWWKDSLSLNQSWQWCASNVLIRSLPSLSPTTTNLGIPRGQKLSHAFCEDQGNWLLSSFTE